MQEGRPLFLVGIHERLPSAPAPDVQVRVTPNLCTVAGPCGLSVVQVSPAVPVILMVTHIATPHGPLGIVKVIVEHGSRCGHVAVSPTVIVALARILPAVWLRGVCGWVLLVMRRTPPASRGGSDPANVHHISRARTQVSRHELAYTHRYCKLSRDCADQSIADALIRCAKHSHCLLQTVYAGMRTRTLSAGMYAGVPVCTE